MHIWLAQSLPEGFFSWFYSQPGQFGPLTSMSGWRPLTFFLLVPQQALCGQSKWEHQTLLPDTAAERVSVLWGHPEPRGWPLPPPGHSLDWLHPWWRRASWHCARPLARAKQTVNMLFQLRHNHTSLDSSVAGKSDIQSTQRNILWMFRWYKSILSIAPLLRVVRSQVPLFAQGSNSLGKRGENDF